MIFTPHVFKIVGSRQVRSAGGDDGQVVPNTTIGTFKGQIDPLTPEQAMDQYNVEARRPFRVMMDQDRADEIEAGHYAVWNEGIYRVSSPPTLVVHGLPTDHAHFLIDLVKNAPNI